MGTIDKTARRADDRVEGRMPDPQRRAVGDRGRGRRADGGRVRRRGRAVPAAREPAAAQVVPARIFAFAAVAARAAGPGWIGARDDGDGGLDAGFDEVGDLSGHLDGLAAWMRREGELAAREGDDGGDR